MSLFIRPYDTSDYPTLISWWKDWEWQPISQPFLPPLGYIVQDEYGTPLVAGFLYHTSSKFMVMEWIISNPSIDKMIRRAALKKLLEEAQVKAKDEGFGALITFTNNKGMWAAL